MNRVVYSCYIWGSLCCLLLAEPVQGEIARARTLLLTTREQQATLGLTRQQGLDLMREYVRQGPYSGQRRLERMFKNFEGSFALAPATPGVLKTVKLTGSVNLSVVKGASRTIVYAQALMQDGRFLLEGLNRPAQTRIGPTDHDIRYRHTATGKAGVIEVKNVKLSSQGSRLPQMIRQLEKHVLYAQTNGELPPILVNRYEVHPRLKEFAHEHGVRVYENVRSHDFSKVTLENIHQGAMWQARTQMVLGGVQVGLGSVLLYQAGGALFEDLCLLSTPGQVPTVLRIGEHSSLLLAGAATTTAGAIEMGVAGGLLQNTSRLAAISRWSGRFGIGAAVVAEGFLLWQYQRGEMTFRQAAVTQANLGGGLLLGTAGAWGGAKGGALLGAGIGSFFPGPGTVIGGTVGAGIGAVVGGVGLGYVGSSLAGAGASAYFEFKDAEQEKALREFIFAHYGTR